MDEEMRKKRALFRFSLIAPILNNTVDTAEEYLKQVCAMQHDVPGLGLREYSPRTLKEWLRLYRKHGFEGLLLKEREDRGRPRSLPSEARAFIEEALKLNPRRPAADIHRELLSMGFRCSRSTVGRYASAILPRISTGPKVERKRFCLPYANDCWQSDTSAGPYITVDGKKRRTHLIAFLDDASRCIVHAEYSFSETYPAIEAAFKKAVLKRGAPKKLFVDNAKVYQSAQMKLIAARLGVVMSWSRPYSPESKGKIERAFYTIQIQFEGRLNLHEIHSLDELNRLLESYIEGEYHRRPHSSLGGLSPMERYLKDKERIRVIDPEECERAFLHEVRRTVSKDATILLDRKLFEVPQIFVGRRVRVLYRSGESSEAFVDPGDGSDLVRVLPLRPEDNSRIPRSQAIDYREVYGE